MPAIRILAILLLALAAGCGYHVGADAPVTLEEQHRKVAITKVTDPTLQEWLGPKLRSRLRDELTRRGHVEWVDKDKASTHIHLTIIRYSESTRVRGTSDQTLKYDSTLQVSVRMVSATDGSTLWESGELSVTESFFQGQQDQTRDLVAELMARLIADRMGQAY